jgi:hypothetical protein
MHSKDETLEAFEDVDARWGTEHGIKMKILHSDNGGEYKNRAFDAYLSRKGIRRRLTVHDTPEHNGVAERLNRTLLEKVRAMLHAADLLKNLWGEVLKHAVWLKNRTSTKALGGRTPYKLFHHEKPDLRNIHEWGCKVAVHVEDNGKLDGRAREGRWLGFDQANIDGHRIYYPDTWSIRVERSVKFMEVKRSGSIYKVLNEGDNADIRLEEKQENIQHTPVKTQQPSSTPPAHESPLSTPPATPTPNPKPKTIAPRDISSSIDPKNIIEGTRTRRSAHLADTEDDDSHANNLGLEYAFVGMGDLSDSPTVEEALTRSDWPLFKAAMDVEMDAMRRTGTFGENLVLRPVAGHQILSRSTFAETPYYCRA